MTPIEIVAIIFLRGIESFGVYEAADAQAGVRARDEEVAGTVCGADPNVIDRRGLPDGKIRGLCPGHRD